MHARALLILGVALLMGVATVVLVNQYLDSQVDSRREAVVIETTSIVVAATNITSGTRMKNVMLKTVQWPKDSVPEGSFTSIENIITEKPPIAMEDLKKGEPVLKHRLSSFGARGGLTTRIPEDMRAVTIPVTEVRGVGGFVSPGSYVDVLHTTDLGRKDKRPVTRMILQNIMVLAIDQISSETETDPKIVNAVTILVSPHDGQRVALAISTGEVSLLLRNEFDASITEAGVVSYEHLLSADVDRKTVVKRRARRETVELIRGLEITNQKVKEGKPAENKEGSSEDSGAEEVQVTP